MPVRLSVNINKIALLRNSRGHDVPNLLAVAQDLERYGAQGITVHPRPDERHVRYADLPILKNGITTEFNIEGYPDKRWLDAVLACNPTQATLVPDAPGALTSNAGWDVPRHKALLTDVCDALRAQGIRASVFIDPDPAQAEAAAQVGADRIELYTEAYAREYATGRAAAVAPYQTTASAAAAAGLQVNAGHDLSLDNLAYLAQSIPELAEVSIGHQLIADALYYGLENVVRMYLRQLTVNNEW